jgi:hypothetical protein
MQIKGSTYAIFSTHHPAQYLTDGSFGKLTVEVGCSISKGLGI